MFRIFFLISFLHVCTSNLNETILPKCLNRIIENELTDVDSVLIITNQTEDLKLNDLYITIGNVRSIEYYYDFYVIETEDLRLSFNELKNNSVLNTNGKFVIIENGNVELNEIFEISWFYGILNIIVLQNGVVYTYFPFRYCMKNISYEIVGNCMDINSFFPNKIPTNLNGCKLSILTVPYSPFVMDYRKNPEDPTSVGVEVTVMNTISKLMNFTTDYSEELNRQFHQHLWKSDHSFGIRLLTEGKAHVIFGSAIVDVSLIDRCDYTLFHINDKISWWVPTAQKTPNWKNIKNIFKSKVWVLIFIAFITNSTTWWLTGKIKNETVPTYKHYTQYVLNSYSVLLQLSILQPKYGLNRFMYILWTSGSVLLFTAYQSQLISILTKPFYEFQISNLNELLNSDLLIGTYPTTYQTYLNSTQMYDSDDKIIICPLNEFCLNRTAFQRDLATLKSKKATDYLITKFYTDENGKPLIVEFKENTITLFLKFCVKKNFPLLKNMSDRLLLLHANGMISMWERKLQPSVYNQPNENNRKTLTISHLQTAFYLLIFGYCLGIVSFTIEITRTTIIFKKIKQNLRKRIKIFYEN